MMNIATVGLDLVKNAFQVHAIDAGVPGSRDRRRLGGCHPAAGPAGADVVAFRSPAPLPIGMEARAGAHHWVRDLAKLVQTVPLIPPSRVKPFVKSGKTDAADAEAKVQRSLDA